MSFIEQLAEGLFYVDVPLVDKGINKWGNAQPRVRDLYIAKAKFAWSFVDDKRAAFTMDQRSV